MFNPITSLSITAGAEQATGANDNHVVVYDQNQHLLPPTDITWSLTTNVGHGCPGCDRVLFYDAGLGCGGKRCCDLSQQPAIRMIALLFKFCSI